MKNEFALAFNEVLEEKGLPRQVILDALESAMVSAYRRAVNASTAQHVEAKIDPETGKVTVFAEKEVVESVQDERTEVALDAAQKIDPEAQPGGMVIVESTPRDFGRVAAQTARQVIQQRIREAERDTQMGHFVKQVGEIVSGIVQAVSPQGATLGLEMKAEGIMPRNQQIPGERFRVHDRVRALLLEVKETPRGPQIILSRAHRNFLRRLLENEVPEIYHGQVEIRSISREPGQRSKVAVAALQPAVDPVGACVGIRGVRIQAIVRELNDEKIDVIEWSADHAVYIAKALSPARVTGVYLNEQSKGVKTATVVVPEDHLSLAIGRDGQNARLAAKLTSWRIDIKSLPEAASDALHKLQSDPEYAKLAEHEEETLPQVIGTLAKKSEGRAVTPEEYQVLSQFVDRVERGMVRQRAGAKLLEDERALEIRAQIHPQAFNIPLEDLPFSDKVFNLLTEAGYHTVGDLMLQIKLEPDTILVLSGVGSKVMREIEMALDTVELPPLEAEPAPTAEATPAETALAEAVLAEAELVEAAPAEAPAGEAATAALETPMVEAAPTVSEAVMPTGEAAPAEILQEPPTKKEAAPAPATDEAVVEEETKEEIPSTLEELLALKPEALIPAPALEEEDEEGEAGVGGKKGKKKKKKFVEIEFDPDQNVVIAKKKRKRGEGWEGDWNV